LSKRLPRRRRRFWRYVSPRRRGLGVTLLAILLATVYGYWYMTNDRRIRRQAERYLRNLTGGRVRVAEADFRLFSGIELRGVSVDVPDTTSPEHFFRAKTVILRHHPWGLFVRGRLEPTEIVCLEPVVTIVHDMQTGTSNAARLLAVARQRYKAPSLARQEQMPLIRVRDALLRTVQKQAEVHRVIGLKKWNLSMAPRGEGTYLITFEEQRIEARAVIQGSLTLDVATGRIRHIGQVPIISLHETLPAEYKQWLDRYRIEGGFKYAGQTDLATGRSTVKLELDGVSLRLPPEQGGLDLSDVTGSIIFDPDENLLKLRDISGWIVQAGNARFKIASGLYEGYEPDSPFSIKLRVDGMELPACQSATGRLAETLRKIHEVYQPSGRINVSATVRRLRDGKVVLTGTGRPDGMTATFKHFPYRIEDLRGTIFLLADRVELSGMTARHGEGKLKIRGRVTPGADQAFDITVEAADISADAELRSALPKQFAHLWDALDPKGLVAAVVHVYRGAEFEHEHVDVTLELDGRASVTYSGFPYPLEKVRGQLRIRDDDVSLDIQAATGPMRCTIHGAIAGINTPRPDVDLKIDATSLPLNETLEAALTGPVREAVSDLRPSGEAGRITARVLASEGKDLDYDILATLKGAKFNHEAFPYAITDAAGVLRIRPGQVTIENLTGRHGKTPIRISGQAFLGSQGLGLDIQAAGDGVRFEKDLFNALPADLQKLWRRLALVGSADMSLAVRHNTPDRPAGTDYRLVMSPKDMQVRYPSSGRIFSGVTGRIVATPQRITLEKLNASAGQMQVSLDGTIVLAESGYQAELSLRADDVPIDAELIHSVPAELAPLTDHLRPGGSCRLDIDKLCFTRSRLARTHTAASAPATKPAGAAAKTTWNLNGSASFEGMIIDMGFGPKELSGEVSGSASWTEALAINADIALRSAGVDRRRLSDLRGRLRKSPRSSLIRIENLSAKAYDGRLAGFAEIRFVQPLQYGLSLSVEQIKLGELLGAEAAETQKRPKVTGLLAGNIQMTATAGQRASRRALGVLRISDARLYKLPVMVGLLRVIHLALPGQTTFSEGNMTYSLKGERLVFREIYLRGASLSIVGSGVVNMNTKALKLTFLAAAPGKLMRIGELDTLLEGISREIMEVRLSGTLDKPVMRTVSLGSLDDAVRRLLSPSQRED